MTKDVYLVGWQSTIEKAEAVFETDTETVVKTATGLKVVKTDTIHTTRYGALNAARAAAFRKGMEDLEIARTIQRELEKADEKAEL